MQNGACFKLFKFRDFSEVCMYLLYKYYKTSYFVLKCEVYSKELAKVFQAAIRKIMVKNY